MDRSVLIYDNLFSLLGMFGKFPGTRYSGGPDVSLYDSGADDAYENYALIDPARTVNEAAIRRGLGFFASSGHAHIWPIFPGAAGDPSGILEDHGLARDADFHAMMADTSEINPSDAGADIVEVIRGDDEAREWACCVWRGFDSDGEPPEQFVSNARGMARDDAFTLVRVGRKAAGMLYASGATCGIHHVATLPEFRGHGLAGTIINALKVRAHHMGFGHAVLLATPSGLKLYLKQGFANVGAVKIYRMDGGAPVGKNL